MASTACTIKDIILITVQNGAKYYGGIDVRGNELTDVQMTVTTEENQRVYYCRNCKQHFEGSETFDECKNHFGTFPD